MKKRTLIIIPTYNEKENVRNIVEKTLSVLDDIDVLVIDDNSPDGTGGIIDEMSKTNKRLHVIHRKGKLGLGTAYITGFRYAISKAYDFIFEMDADFSHNPDEIPRFLHELKSNDLVLGSRYLMGINVVNWPLSRLILSYGANVYTRLVTGMPVKDATSGFKGFRRTALEALNLNNINSNGYSFQIEVSYKIYAKGMKVKEIPIIFVDRVLGKSKMSHKIIKEAAFMVWKLKFRKIFGLLK